MIGVSGNQIHGIVGGEAGNLKKGGGGMIITLIVLESILIAIETAKAIQAFVKWAKSRKARAHK